MIQHESWCNASNLMLMQGRYAVAVTQLVGSWNSQTGSSGLQLEFANRVVRAIAGLSEQQITIRAARHHLAGVREATVHKFCAP